MCGQWPVCKQHLHQERKDSSPGGPWPTSPCVHHTALRTVVQRTGTCGPAVPGHGCCRVRGHGPARLPPHCPAVVPCAPLPAGAHVGSGHTPSGSGAGFVHRGRRVSAGVGTQLRVILKVVMVIGDDKLHGGIHTTSAGCRCPAATCLPWRTSRSLCGATAPSSWGGRRSSRQPRVRGGLEGTPPAPNGMHSSKGGALGLHDRLHLPMCTAPCCTARAAAHSLLAPPPAPRPAFTALAYASLTPQIWAAHLASAPLPHMHAHTMRVPTSPISPHRRGGWR